MKILIVDLETMPMLSYHFKRWKENISLPQTVHDSYLASFAAQWLGEDEVMYDGLDNYTMAMSDEKAVASSLWKLYNQADAVITFNGDNFDNKVANTAFIRAGMKPPTPYKSIDLFKQAKKNFRFSSNSLKNVTRELGVKINKHENEGWKLWVACCNKDKKAWAEMQEYNIQDIRVTREVYYKMLPWIKNHPNVALFNDEEVPMCRNCGSDHLVKNGFDYTNTTRRQRYRCKSCGANNTAKQMLTTKDKRDTILV